MVGVKNVGAIERVVEVLDEHSVHIDREARFPIEALNAMRSEGMLGALVSREFGGWGLSLTEVAHIANVLAGHCVSSAMIWAMHCQQVAVVNAFASAEVKRDALTRVAADGWFIGSVTSEPGKGGHLMTAVAPVVADGGAILVERDAPVVTGGRWADLFLITMRRNATSASGEVVLVLAKRADLTVDVRAQWDTLGMRGTESVGMTLTGRLDPSCILGEGVTFTEIATTTMIPVGHIMWAACWIGAAAGALRRFVGDRAVRASEEARSDLFAERLARVRAEIEIASAFLDTTLREYEHALATTDPAAVLVSPAFNIRINNLKVVASEHVWSAADRLMQLGGLQRGYGRGSSLRIEQTFRDLRSAMLMYSNDRLWVASGKLALLDRAIRLRNDESPPSSETASQVD